MNLQEYTERINELRINSGDIISITQSDRILIGSIIEIIPIAADAYGGDRIGLNINPPVPTPVFIEDILEIEFPVKEDNNDEE